MTPTRPPDRQRPAGFWQREVAWLLDAALLGVGAHALLAFWSALPLPWPAALEGAALRALLWDGLALVQDPWATPEALRSLLDALLVALAWMVLLGTAAYAVLAFPYFVLQESGRQRATLGKRALGLVVANRDGSAPAMARASARHLAAALSWATLNLGHALAAWTPSRQALHDRVSATRVLAATPAMPGWARVLVALQAALALAPPLTLLLLLGWLALPG